MITMLHAKRTREVPGESRAEMAGCARVDRAENIKH